MASVSFLQDNLSLGQSMNHRMMRNSKIVAAFGGGDDHSIDFSVESDLFDKLGIQKAKVGEESAFDNEKLYRYQLEKDIGKLTQSKGTFAERNALYLNARAQDPFFELISSPTMVGADGDFSQLLPYSAEESWRSTSQPYGVIAHKRYLEYLSNLPKGPSNEEIKDRLQRSMDREVWEKVVTGKYDPTKKELLRAKQMALRRELQESQIKHVNYYEQLRIDREQAFKDDNFHLMRHKFSEKEIASGLKGWNRGIHRDFDIDKGMPYVIQVVDSVSDQLDRNIEDKTGASGPRVFRSDTFIQGNIGNEKQYSDFLCELNLDKTEKHLKQQQRNLEKEKKLKELAAMEQQRNRRRVALTGLSIADQVLQAKIATAQEKVKFKLALDKKHAKHGENDDEEIERDKFFLAAQDENDATKMIAEHEQLAHIVPQIKAREVLQEEALDGDSDSSSSSSSSDNESNSDSDAHQETHGNGGSSPAAKFALHGEFLDDARLAPARAHSRMHEMLARAFSAARAPSSAAAHYQASHTTTEIDQTPRSDGKTPRGSGKRKKSSVVPTNNDVDLQVVVKKPVPHAHTWRDRWEEKDFSREAWEEWIEKTRAAHLAHSVHKRFKRIHHFLYDETLYKTRTEREKDKEINRLHDLAEQINQVPFRERVMGLVEGDLSMQEFMREAKKKNRDFLKKIRLMSKHRLKKHETRHLELLQLRYDRFLATVKERKNRERDALQIIDIMHSLIVKEQERVQDKDVPRDEQVFGLFVNRFVKRRAGKKKESVKKLSKFLPSSSTERDEEEIDRLVSLRILEKDLEKKKKHFVAWLLKRPVKERERDEKSYLDELVYAAQVGDYRTVLDILDNREQVTDSPFPLADVNGVTAEQTTATFSVLYNVIKQEMSEDNTDLDMLFLSPFERFVKRFQPKTPTLMDTVRFDLVVQILLHYGGDLMFPKAINGPEGLTVFHCAVQSGALEVAEFLLDRGVDPNHFTTVHLRSPLMLAVERDNLDMVMFLLQRGAMLSLPHVDNLGCNVLHYAARHASPLLTEILMMCGATNNCRNNKGYLPMEEAQLKNRTELSVMISSFNNGLNDTVMRLDTLLKNLNKQNTNPEDLLGNMSFDDTDLVVDEENGGEEDADDQNHQFRHGAGVASFKFPAAAEPSTQGDALHLQVVDTDNGDARVTRTDTTDSAAMGVTPNERLVKKVWGSNNKLSAKQLKAARAKQRAENKKQMKSKLLSSINPKKEVNRNTVLTAPKKRKTMLQMGLVNIMKK